jgi:hypothetical protein
MRAGRRGSNLRRSAVNAITDTSPSPAEVEAFLAEHAAGDAAKLAEMVQQLNDFAEELADVGRRAKAHRAQAVPVIYSSGAGAAVLVARHLAFQLKRYRIGA